MADLQEPGAGGSGNSWGQLPTPPLQPCDPGRATSLLCLIPASRLSWGARQYLLVQFMRGKRLGWRRACSAHPETVSYCHGGDCELRRSRYAGPSWPPHPGQRAVPQAGSQAPGCEGRAWRVAGEAVTVDDRQLMLISAAVTCPLDPQPTTGRLTPSRCFTNMSPPLHPLCPTSAQATIISPLFHLFLPLSSQRDLPKREIWSPRSLALIPEAAPPGPQSPVL